jgi:hypothetical protein
MATAATVTSVVSEVQGIADLILKTIEGVDPTIALPAEMANQVVDLLAGLANKAISAWSASSGVQPTVDNVQALLPNPTPLTPPNAPTPTGTPLTPPTTPSK